MNYPKITLFVVMVAIMILLPSRVFAVNPIVTVTASSSQPVSQGTLVTYTIDVAWGVPSDQFTLTLNGLPSGASYSFSTNPVTIPVTLDGTSTLTIDTSTLPLYCPGVYSFTVTATSGPNVGTSSLSSLTVSQAGPPLQVAVSAGQSSYQTGQTVVVSFSINRPAEGQVTITGPPGFNSVTYPFQSQSPGSSTVPSFTAGPVGTYTVTVQADDYCSGVSSAQTTFTVSPNAYPVTVSTSGLPSQYSPSIQIDGQAQGQLQGSKILNFPIGSSHTISVDQYVSGATGERYYCAQNTWSTSSSDTHTFDYSTQYQLTVATDPSGIAQVGNSGWFDAGSSAQTGSAPQTVPGTPGIQYIFSNWVVDGSPQSGTQISVSMNGPHSAVAKYTTQYQLTVNSPNGLGNPQGAGFYNAGSTAQFSVTSPVGFLTQQVFQQWQGDYSGTSPQGSITMDSPKTVNAVWTTSNTNLYIVAAAVIALLLIGAGVATRRRGGKETPKQPTEPKPEEKEETEKKHGLHLGREK